MGLPESAVVKTAWRCSSQTFSSPDWEAESKREEEAEEGEGEEGEEREGDEEEEEVEEEDEAEAEAAGEARANRTVTGDSWAGQECTKSGA